MDLKLLPSKWLKRNALNVRREANSEANDTQDEHRIYSLQTEVNRLFEDFFRATEMPMFGSTFGLSPFSDTLNQSAIGPRIDVHETGKELRVAAELPGLNENEIDVSLSRDVLTISGEKKQESEQNVKGWYRMERSYGAFTRSIPLPCEVDRDSCSASFKNGVLTVSLNKTPQAQADTKCIPIKKE